MDCCFCGTAVFAGRKVYLKSKEEEVHCIIEILKKKYIFSKEEVQVFLRSGVVCKGKCQTELNKIVKLKKELLNLEL
jgi:predicted RNase H-like nuclease